jgi:hypothetical protein
MCPPEYFDVAYIINPWMHGNMRKIDNAVAKQQWRALYDILCDHATVRLVLPQPGSPDMVFTANAGLVTGKHFIVSRFRYPSASTRSRTSPTGSWTAASRCRSCRATCRSRARATRSSTRERPPVDGARPPLDVAAREEIVKHFKTRVVTLQLVDQRFYHLDTCFCPLDGGYLMYYPPAFDEPSRKRSRSGARATAHRHRRGRRAQLRLQRGEHRPDVVVNRARARSSTPSRRRASRSCRRRSPNS